MFNVACEERVRVGGFKLRVRVSLSSTMGMIQFEKVYRQKLSSKLSLLNVCKCIENSVMNPNHTIKQIQILPWQEFAAGWPGKPQKVKGTLQWGLLP